MPLALLRAVRDRDYPGELLEAEDLSASLPRRFGLSGVVSNQIQRYEAAADARTPVAVSELSSLLQLVLRRPDAEEIMRETGRSVMRNRLGAKAPLRIRLLRRSTRLVFAPIRRAARRLLRGMVGAAEAEVAGKPLVVRIQPAFTAKLGEAACGLYTGALEELVRVWSGRDRGVDHSRCAARGDALCEWRLDDGTRPAATAAGSSDSAAGDPAAGS